EPLEPRRLLSALDLSFGAGGEAIVPLDIHTQVTVVQPDGKIILAGNDAHEAVIARLNSNGDLDRPFGDDGWTRIDIAGKGTVRAVAVLPSGKILIGGPIYEDNYFIARLRADGT